MSGKKLQKNLTTFLRHIDAIRDTLPMTILLLLPYNKKAKDQFVEYLKNNVEEIEDDSGKKTLLINSDEIKLYESLERNSSISSLATKIIPESLFVSLISQYDAFLNRLLRSIFEIRPELLNNSERNLTFSQLVGMKSIEEAREFIIEKEIETVLRKSHSEQFEYLENKLGMELRKNLPIWQTFVEITERRNLLVHCDGIASSQYFKICSEHNCDISKVKIGTKLHVNPEYFGKAYRCLYEISTKLTHTIWRKLLKDDLLEADRELNDICLELINNNHYKLADILLDFACGQKKHFDEALKNVFLINKALSAYLQDKKDIAKTILNSKDWSATSNDFKLAHSVLTDDFNTAYDLMKKIGSNGDIEKADYKVWPLFNVIRDKKGFQDTFQDIFGEEYKVLETPMRPVQEIINKEIKKDKSLKNKTVKKVNSKKHQDLQGI